jgi:hypothetical protein
VQVAGSRYYNPGLGRWASRDPMGEIGAANLYAVVQNATTVLVDVLGLFTLQWQGGNWSPQMKAYFQQRLADVKSRAAAVRSQAIGALISLPHSPCYDDLRTKLIGLAGLLGSVIADIDGTSPLDVCMGDIGTQEYGLMTQPVMPWFHDKMTLNTNSTACFFGDVTEAKGTVFHEISHLHGTHHNLNGDVWMDADAVETLITRDDISGWTYYVYDKRRADRCACAMRSR